MPGTFFGLESALRSLRAQQKAIDVVNHNIANANTPGYSRQEAVMAAGLAYSVPALNRDNSAGQVGTGVEVTGIRRTRDSFVDLQLRTEIATQGQWEAARDYLQQVEAVFNEPSTSGLNTLLSRFWQSWQDLVNAPADGAVRSNLLEQAKALTSAINYDASQLDKFIRDADQQIQLTVQDVNSIADRLATLNKQIAQVQLTGQAPNDLADERDQLLDRLYREVKVSVAYAPNGMVQVFVNNRLLVDGSENNHLGLRANATGLHDVIWQDDPPTAQPISLSGGALKGLVDQMATVLPGLKSDLDALALSLRDAVNDVHVSGYGLNDVALPDPPRAFFSGTGADDLAVAVTDPADIAASDRPGAEGNRAKAQEIIDSMATITSTRLTGIGVREQYQAFVAKLGVASRTASEAVDNQDVLVKHLQRRRETLSGVSLDEETVNLLKYQQAYEASARVITAVDQMLDTLINRTGVVGR